MKTIRLAIITACALFLIGGLATYFIKSSGTNTYPVKSSGKALVGGHFSLIDHKGNAVSDQTFRGKLMLVFFGFTHCPDICPAELQVMSTALDGLGDKISQVQSLFITIDPERDTRENMAAYMEHFHKKILGLHGTKKQIAVAAKAYRIYYKKIENKDFPDDYTMDHTSFIYLMGREGEYLTHFPYGTPPEIITATLKKYIG